MPNIPNQLKFKACKKNNSQDCFYGPGKCAAAIAGLENQYNCTESKVMIIPVDAVQLKTKVENGRKINYVEKNGKMEILK